MSNSFNNIKAMLQKEKENLEFKKAVRTVYSKPRNHLTKQVAKAAKQAPGGLECFKEENMHYSTKDTQRWMEGTSYFENYQAMKGQDSYE